MLKSENLIIIFLQKSFLIEEMCIFFYFHKFYIRHSTIFHQNILILLSLFYERMFFIRTSKFNQGGHLNVLESWEILVKVLEKNCLLEKSFSAFRILVYTISEHFLVSFNTEKSFSILRRKSWNNLKNPGISLLYLQLFTVATLSREPLQCSRSLFWLKNVKKSLYSVLNYYEPSLNLIPSLIW